MVPMQEVAAAVQSALPNVHAGELPGEAIGEISVLAGVLGRLFLPLIPKVGDDEKQQRFAVMTLSAVAMGLYCREAGVAIIGHGFTIVSVFGAVALATLGMFNLSDPQNFTKANLSSVANSASFGMVGKTVDPQNPPPPPSV